MSQPQENFHRPDCLKDASTVFVPKGTRVFQTGDPCNRFFYLLTGSIRVDLIARNGRTIMLYRFGGGETCVLTTSCLLGGDAYCAEAVAEEDTRACALPADAFEAQLSRSADFRRIVFSSFSARLAAMMEKVEEVAFVPIDRRLADRALQMHRQSPDIRITHERLAADLGTAREVISRKLAEWEKQGFIERGRGMFRIRDTAPLERLASLGD